MATRQIRIDGIHWETELPETPAQRIQEPLGLTPRELVSWYHSNLRLRDLTRNLPRLQELWGRAILEGTSEDGHRLGIPFDRWSRSKQVDLVGSPCGDSEDDSEGEIDDIIK